MLEKTCASIFHFFELVEPNFGKCEGSFIEGLSPIKHVIVYVYLVFVCVFLLVFFLLFLSLSLSFSLENYTPSKLSYTETHAHAPIVPLALALAFAHWVVE